ncbi:hypothetical protein B484DRAFT_464711 [Ochromonadaceae sp. CCMP2298]|nr:hypothetical protein B484DRAFT_464711 [Ochromonadaceae sp. CCMP2298]
MVEAQQICPTSTLTPSPTKKDNKKYRGKLVGDSPEICRALDAHSFADLKLSMAYHTSLSSIYDFNDPCRFGMGTPKKVWETMTSPSAMGAAMSHDLKKVLKHKPRPSQRKETLVGRPCHPDCWAARTMIKAQGAPAAEAVQDAALGLLLLIEVDDAEREEAQEQNRGAQLEDESTPQAEIV